MFLIKVAEKIKTKILYSKRFHKNPAHYEIVWKNMVEPDRPQMTILYGACAFRAV